MFYKHYNSLYVNYLVDNYIIVIHLKVTSKLRHKLQNFISTSDVNMLLAQLCAIKGKEKKNT